MASLLLTQDGHWQKLKPCSSCLQWSECWCPTPKFMGSSLVAQLIKISSYNAGDPSSTPGSGRSTVEGVGYPLQYSWASLVAQLEKNPPAMWQIWIQPLGWEDPQEKGTATHSSILPGEFHGCATWSYKESDTTEWLSLLLFLNSYMMKPSTPKTMYLEGGTLGSCLGHEDGALMKGISIL